MSMIALMAIKASCSGELSNSAAVNVVIGKCKNDIAQIEEDPRYPRNHEQFANIQINAPLALIQLEMKTRVAALQSVIDFASGM